VEKRQGGPRYSAAPLAIYSDSAFFDRLRRCGVALGRALEAGRRVALPGVTPIDVASEVEREIGNAGGRVLLKGLRVPGAPAFPAGASLSVNEVAVNGVPTGRALDAGDVVTIDSACELDGAVCDAAVSLVVGGGQSTLIEAARSVLRAAIGAIRPGAAFAELAEAARAEAHRLGFALADEAIAHGTGQALHQRPGILPVGTGMAGGEAGVFEIGMVLAVEPVVVEVGGSWDGVPMRLRTLGDGWSRAAAGRSAYEERTVVVTASGAEEITGLAY